MKFIAEKSISNTRKEVKNSSSFSFMNSDISVNCARCERYCLDLFSELIQTLIRESFDEATTMTMLQMSATNVLMQIVVESKDSKATTTCMKIDFLDQNHQ